jgi:hypothetical protein
MHFHLVVDTFSQLFNATKNPRVPNNTIDALLFALQLEWLQEVHTYISANFFKKGYSMEQQKKLLLKALPFTIINGMLYKQG